MKKPIRLSAAVSSALLAPLFLILSGPSANAKLEFDSNQLMMKNADQVSDMVVNKIKKAQKIQSQQDIDDDVGIQAEPEAIALLKDALRISLSRPDQDGSRANLFARVRRELADLNAFDPVIKDLTNEAISALKNSSTPVRHQGTYVVILENLMAEMKPDLKSNDLFRKMVEQIRDADIKLSDKLKSQEYLRAMRTPTSPSETATKILPKDEKKK